MKRNFLILLLLFGGIFLTFRIYQNREPAEGNIYPLLSQLNHFNVNEVKGKYLLLHFWAKWCEPCAEEIPQIIEFSKLHFQKPMKVLAVSLDSTLEEAKTILPEQGRLLPENFILALDPEHRLAEGMGSYQYPETYWVSPEGVVLEKWVGAQKWNKPEVIEFFNQKIK